MSAVLCKQSMTSIFLVACFLFANSESSSLQEGIGSSNDHSAHEIHTRSNENCRTNNLILCASWTFERGEYMMFPNRTIHIPSYNLSLNICSYILQNGNVVVCRSHLKDRNQVLTIPCGVQLAIYISVLSVFLPVLFSMITEDVRDLVHVNWRGLIMSVFFFHFLLQTVNIDKVSDVQEFRYTFPALMHFFTLVLLSWMTIISYNGMTMNEGLADNDHNYIMMMRNFRGHTLSIFTIIIVLVTFTLVTEVLGIIPPNFKPESGDFCWLTQKTLLLFFTGPVFTFSVINFANFISTYCLFTKQGVSSPGPPLILKKNYLVHFKLFAIVDITWLMGVLIFLTELEWLWRIFVFVFIIEEAFIVVVPFNKYLEKWVLTKLSGG